jgi:hypothetical protein
MMWRFIGDQVYGVLTDYDLSSWIRELKGDYTKTSQQRTGTPPYMAYELLRGTHTTHLRRHDIESFFYIMLLTCGRHTFGYAENGKGPWRMVMRKEPLPYATWFNQQNYHTLGGIKYAFLMDEDEELIELSPAFEDFRGWLEQIHTCFITGIKARPTKKTIPWMIKQAEGSNGVGSTPVPYSDETLGGYVDYKAIIEPVRDLKGDLEGLVIRYDP